MVGVIVGVIAVAMVITAVAMVNWYLQRLLITIIAVRGFYDN